MTVKDLILILQQFPQELTVEVCMEVDSGDFGKCHGPIHTVGLSERTGRLEICAADYDLLENI